MYSKPIKFLIALSGLFPIFLIFWLEKMFTVRKQLRFYISGHDLWSGLKDFVALHGFLLIFLLLLFTCWRLLRFAATMLSPRTIDVKSIKPADVNFVSILLSYLAPWFKVYLEGPHDYIYIAGFLLIAFVYGLVNTGSYHYNISFRVFFGYKHFEVATMREVTYLVLSKKALINKNQLTAVVYLTDYMLINIT